MRLAKRSGATKAKVALGSPPRDRRTGRWDVPVTPVQAGTHFPFDPSDESSRVEFDFLDHDLRALKRRYAAALEKKADTADQPQVAEDFRAIAERVVASFDSLIRLTDHLGGLGHDNDDQPA